MTKFAAIDVGSNASRLLIVQAKEPTRVSVFRSLRRPVRMGHEVFQTGRLDPDTIELSVRTLREFAEAMESADVERYQAVVTASARSARNGAQLIARVLEETGIRLHVVPGAEEARLVSIAVHEVMEPGKALLMDLGGGSLELSDLREGDGFIGSLTIGTVRLLEAFLDKGDPVTNKQGLLIREHIDRLLAPYRRELRSRNFDRLIGTGGNLRAAAALAPSDSPGEFPTIDIAKAKVMRDLLASLPASERMAQFDLKRDRAEVIVPALFVIVAMAEMCQLDEVVCPNVGLKEGIVRELVDKHYRVWDYKRERDQLFAAALQLGRRYHFDEGHGTLVSSFACAIFDGTTSLHSLGVEDRAILRIAALLHDIGDFINPSSHHKHTKYLIENSDLMGLPPDQRKLVALVARYHRRAPPALRHTSYAKLGSADRDRVKQLSAMLRLADSLDRGHRGKIEAITVEVQPNARAVVIHADCQDDVSLESWTLDRKADLFRDVYGVEVLLTENTKPSAHQNDLREAFFVADAADSPDGTSDRDSDESVSAFS